MVIVCSSCCVLRCLVVDAGDDRRGVLREGARADFVAIAETRPGGSEGPDGWTVARTYVAGRRAWPDPEPPV